MSVATVDALVSVGNSDDKLTQADWSRLVYEAFEAVSDRAVQVHGEWGSPTFSRFQNAAVAFTIGALAVDDLRAALGKVAAAYKQDSIALLVGQAEFIPAADGHCGGPSS